MVLLGKLAVSLADFLVRRGLCKPKGLIRIGHVRQIPSLAGCSKTQKDCQNRYCERSEATQKINKKSHWIATSGRALLAMTAAGFFSSPQVGVARF